MSVRHPLSNRFRASRRFPRSLMTDPNENLAFYVCKYDLEVLRVVSSSAPSSRVVHKTADACSIRGHFLVG